MLRRFLHTDGGIAGLLLRLTLAVVMFPHGAQKALGWFGGRGFEQTLASFTRSGIPLGLALLVIVTEFLGPLGLAVGLLSRVVAVGFICEMLVAVVRVHWRHGFFMNWTGTQPGEGFEYHLLVIGMALTILIIGAGIWSLDRALAGRPPARGHPRQG
jgi:putative oxidoreductase